MVDFTVSQNSIIDAFTEDKTVHDLNILDFLEYLSKITKTFHNHVNAINISNNVLNSLFSEHILHRISEFNITNTLFTIDNITYKVNTNEIPDITYVKICNSIFDNCNKATTMWTSTGNKYNSSIYSEFNGLDVNNGNSTLLSIINNTFCISVLNFNI